MSFRSGNAAPAKLKRAKITLYFDVPADTAEDVLARVLATAKQELASDPDVTPGVAKSEVLS